MSFFDHEPVQMCDSRHPNSSSKNTTEGVEGARGRVEMPEARSSVPPPVAAPNHLAPNDPSSLNAQEMTES